ncbi:ABC transporter ATP-binding protein [Methylocapsa aurea]|uniref:ABC transporter ATP-binding protein n=1 Tax=Methylocapsa aurea TaxID=663610 RepID=UPI00055A83B1|nr:ABC transporter ATP-binding protein [Methylocapsa aurea]
MIELREVSKSFGGALAVDNLSLRIEGGAFFVLIGPSGCGKSTVLRMINAMISCDRGKIEIGGQDIAKLDPVTLRRGIGYVIQSGGLFPHWTIKDNIAAVPRLLGWSDARCAERLDEIVAMLRIDPALLPRYPRQLSGGQQQRIGVARALAADPDVILMDEPFAALDPVSRADLQEELRRLHAQSCKTIVFVTHDMDEALRLATHMAVMNKGALVQTGAPAEIMLRPADQFVRAFLGGDNLPLRLLEFTPVQDRLRSGSKLGRIFGQGVGAGAGETIAASASLKAALTLMLARGCDHLDVEDESGARLGEIHAADIIAGDDAR